MPITFLIDVNNAFLSMHAAYLLQHGYETDLRTIPCIIGGSEKSRHGICLAKSYPAKAKGIKTAMTIKDCKALCENLKVVSPDYSIYVAASRQMNRIFSEYTMYLEKYSIDESFLSFEGHDLLYDDYIALAYEIKDRIKKEIDINVSVGIGNTKYTAKMANNGCNPDSVNTLLTLDEIKEKMWSMDIRKLHGVGSQIEKKLRNYGINSIKDIVNIGPDFMKNIFKSNGSMLYNYCWGRDTSIINNPKHQRTMSIGNSHTNRWNITNYEDAYNLITTLCETISARLRNLDRRSMLISVAIKNTDFIVKRKQSKLKFSIAATSDIIFHAKRLFNLLWDCETPLRHIEVRVGELVENDLPQQLILFEEDQPDDRGEKIDNVIDELRSRFGAQSIVRATLINSGYRAMSGGHPGGSDIPNMRSEL
ncbi:MAG: DNA polymerase IV [Clostridiales bacterium]|nr:DNA polymerase IV [Clostridiales bacterium]